MKYYLGVFTLLLIVIFTAPFLSKISRQSFVSDVFAYIPCEEDWECSEGQVCRTSDGRCVTDRTPTNPPAPTNTAAPQQPTSQPTTPPQQPPAGGDKTCWVSGQDQCQPNCQKQVNFSCSDGSNYSHIENCCGGNEGGNNTPTPIPPTPGPGDPTNPPTPVIPACSYTSGIKLQFKHAWLPSAVYSDTIQIREGEPVLVRAVAKPDGSTAIAAGFEFLVNGTVQSPMSAPVTELGYATPIGITSPNAPYTGVVTVKTLVPGFLLTDTNCTSTGQITVLPKLTKPIIPPEYMNPICNSDGWNSTFSWAKPPTDNRMDSFNLRINMTNLWMNNPPEALWFLNDASDQFIVTGNVTTKTSTIIPFRLYDGWSIQSIMANYPGTATADADAISSGNKFMCIPKYTAPTGTCLDDEGNLTDECDLNNWIAEYRRQYGYDGTNAVLNRLNAYPNLVTGENAYDAKDSANQPLELIDLLDFEALRKKLSTTILITDTPTTAPTQGVTVSPTTPPDQDVTETPIPTSSTPTEATRPDNFRVLAMSYNSICAIKEDNTLVCWGNNQWGQVSPPSTVGKVKEIAGGNTHFCAVKLDDHVACWGNNNKGQSTVPGDLRVVKKISVGKFHSCVVTDSNTVKCWGDDTEGQTLVPTDLGTVRDISAQTYKTCAITNSNSLRCWGDGQNIPSDLTITSSSKIYGSFSILCITTPNTDTQCWNSLSTAYTPAAEQIGQIKNLTVGSSHVCVIKPDNAVNCWGYGTSSSIPPLDLGPVQYLSSYSGTTCALQKNNSIRCWGNEASNYTVSPPQQ